MILKRRKEYRLNQKLIKFRELRSYIAYEFCKPQKQEKVLSEFQKRLKELLQEPACLIRLAQLLKRNKNAKEKK